jgi:hypothetical protein
MQDKELYEKLPCLTAPWSVQEVNLQMKEMKVQGNRTINAIQS